MRGLHARLFVALADRRYADLRGRRRGPLAAAVRGRARQLPLSPRVSAGAGRLRERVAARWRPCRASGCSRGHLSEGRRWLETTLESSGVSRVAARALRGLALIAMEQGDIDRAADVAEEAMPLGREKWRRGGGRAVDGFLADIGAHRGDLDAPPACGRSVRSSGGVWDGDWSSRSTLYSLAYVARLQRAFGTRGDVPRRVARDLQRIGGCSRPRRDAYRPCAGSLGAGRRPARTQSMLSARPSSTRAYSFVAGLLDLLELYAMVLERRENPRRRRGFGGRATRWAARSAARPTIRWSSPRTMRRSRACAPPLARRPSSVPGISVAR